MTDGDVGLAELYLVPTHLQSGIVTIQSYIYNIHALFWFRDSLS